MTDSAEYPRDEPERVPECGEVTEVILSLPIDETPGGLVIPRTRYKAVCNQPVTHEPGKHQADFAVAWETKP